MIAKDFAILKIKRLEQIYKKEYVAETLQEIIKVFLDLSFDEMNLLTTEVINTIRTLPLRADLLAAKDRLKLPKTKISDLYRGTCKWCGNEGMVYALRLRDKHEVVFKCTCVAGRELSDSFLIWDDQKCDGKFRKLKHGEVAYDKV